MQRYDPKTIEPKWQQIWDSSKLYEVDEKSKQTKYYALEFFPYPSGATLHVGHVRNYTINDTWARYQRMLGKSVLHPMGWDAFGLPAENYAIKNGVTPRKSTDANIRVFKKQFCQMGFSYDWSREIDSSRPEYYKWTQWLFLKFFEKGLAYRKKALVNWCPQDKTVLANEQVVGENNVCERCGTPVVQKELEQWFLKITDYADRLLEDLDELDWPESIKVMQRNWIGRSRGALVDFKVADSSDKIPVFTTRADTIFSAAFIVLAPEHDLVKGVTKPEKQFEVEKYVEQALRKTELDRMEEEKSKTGVFTGSYAINPSNKEKIPIWVADFVIGGYGTGAVFGDIHDERDFEFLKKYKITAKPTVLPEDKKEAEKVKNKEYPFTGEGILIDSGEFSGMHSAEARDKIIAWLKKQNSAKEQVNYRLRDWSISRQRYWGCPIPIIYCQSDGIVPVPEKDLPVRLPEDVEFKPTGQSPLLDIPDFVKAKCPKCGKDGRRETDTLDTFIDSSWYFLRFADPHNGQEVFAKSKVDYWMPVDMYVGGAEHAVLHLLYARFWTKFLYDQGLVSINEPFKALRNQGMIGGADGRKMGKRYGNEVTPDQLIEKGYGADALRLYELFIAPFDQGVPWDPQGIVGTRRFLDRVWTLVQEFIERAESLAAVDNQNELETQVASSVQRATKKITEDLEEFGLNTAVAALMELVNELYKLKIQLPFAASPKIWQQNVESLIKLVAPFAPHITEELWSQLEHDVSIHIQDWPNWDAKLIKEELVTIVVQVNGKVRANITAAAGTQQKQLVEQAKTDPNVSKYLKSKELAKTITVGDRLVNFVTK